MIESLRLRDVAIVEEAELELGPGFNVITGETGAGKSIVLGALSLLAGARASSDLVREGSESCVVEAVLRTDGRSDLEAALAERGLQSEAVPGDDEVHELVVSRTVSAGGRSRARVATALVPVTSLAELFASRIEISSQHSSQALRRSESHGRFLDAVDGAAPLCEAVRHCFEAVRTVDAELATLREQAEERLRRRDFLAFQLAEIDEAELGEGEIETLENDHARLSNATQLRVEGQGAVGALLGDPATDARGAVDGLAEAQRLVEGLAEVDRALAPAAERLRGVASEVADVASDLERHFDAVEADPARLARIEERIGQVDRLRRKYGSDEAAIRAFRDEAARELESLEGADERSAALADGRVERVAALHAAAQALTASRKKAASKLVRRVQKGLRELAMPHASFAVDLARAPAEGALPEGVRCGPAGAELPEFQFSANEGEPLRSLQKVASGGELSRVFLVLQNALRGASRGGVLVFDEVDAGIGGGVAEKVGRALVELSREHQVLCITHLPQIAAFADQHFCVRKQRKAKRTVTTVERLEGDARVDEIARMAGGASISKATRRHAEELLRARD